MAWDIDNVENLNPSFKKYWGDEENDEWVKFRVVSEEASKKIRKKIGIKTKVEYIPNPITKRMDQVIKFDEKDQEKMEAFQDALNCEQIDSWNFKTPAGESIECNDENKRKLLYGSPLFAKWVVKQIKDIEKEQGLIEEEEEKNF